MILLKEKLFELLNKSIKESYIKTKKKNLPENIGVENEIHLFSKGTFAPIKILRNKLKKQK